MKKIDGAVITVNERKKSVTAKVKLKDRYFFGVATCHENDEFDVDFGKELALWRVELEVRKHDLQKSLDVLDALQCYYNVENTEKKPSEVSKHWMHFIQEVSEEIENQREHIRFCKRSIKELTDGKK